jgi:hypothetical protein
MIQKVLQVLISGIIIVVVGKMLLLIMNEGYMHKIINFL